MAAHPYDNTSTRLFLSAAALLALGGLGACGAPERDGVTLVFLLSGLPPEATELHAQLVQGSQTAERTLPIVEQRAELSDVRKLATHVVLTTEHRGEPLVVELTVDSAQASGDRVEQAVDFGYDPCDYEPMPELCPNAWTELVWSGPAPVARDYPYCAFDGDHSVVVFGGLTGTVGMPTARLNDVWRFDLESRTWQLLWEHTTEPAGTFPKPRYAGAGAIYADAFYAFSGVHELNGTDRFEIWRFDLASATWQEVIYFDEGEVLSNAFFGATYDASLGSLWLYGGTATTYSYALDPFFFRYDFVSDSLLGLGFVTTSDHHYMVDELAMAIGGLNESRALVAFGGNEGNALVNPNRVPRDETWRFEFQASDWHEVPLDHASHPESRFSPTFTSLTEDVALLFGGANTGSTYGDTWRYSMAEDAWERLSPRGEAVPVARVGHCAVALGSNRVLVFGGRTGASAYPDLNDVWVFVVR